MSEQNTNKALKAEKNFENDEFYTYYKSIEEEVSQYKLELENKVVYCNCDNPTKSNFFKFFVEHFEDYKLKELICTCYQTTGSLFADDATGFGEFNRAYKVVVNSSNIGGIKENPFEIIKDDILTNSFQYVELLKGNGSFMSGECLELLDKADIIVSNPPFSKYVSYLSVLIEHGKKFLIVGNKNAITYVDVFKFIRNNKVWAGNSAVAYFVNAFGEEINIGNAGWFTNTKSSTPRKEMPSTERYCKEKYQKFDNYNAINVDKLKDFPIDYCESWGVEKDWYYKNGKELWKCVREDEKFCWIVPNEKNPLLLNMINNVKNYQSEIELALPCHSEYCNGWVGLPITILDYYNSDTMRVLELLNCPRTNTVNGKSKYARILIQKLYDWRKTI